MTDYGIFRNFIDDKFGIIDKPERERGLTHTFISHMFIYVSNLLDTQSTETV